MLGKYYTRSEKLIHVVNWCFVAGVRNVVRNACNTVVKATEKHTQERNNKRSDGVRGIVDTATPRMTAQTWVKILFSVLYDCHSGVQLYRPISVVEMTANTIDMIRTIHSSTESTLMTQLHLGYFTEHGICQRILVVK
jgi:hypothetical protein